MAEINELKEKITTLQGKLDAYQMSEQEANEIIAELKAENARLTSLLGEYSLKADAYRNAEDITQQSNYNLSMENFKLKQTLQEIKAIAENAYCLTNYTNKDMANFAKQILATITKAEEE